jgi:hypothetical protein
MAHILSVTPFVWWGTPVQFLKKNHLLNIVDENVSE